MKYQDDLFYIERILNGDMTAYASLVQKHQNMVFSIAHRILNNREDAEEVAQDSFLKAYQGLKAFEKKSKFSTWLYRIVYNAAISRTRKKKLEFVAMSDHVITNYSEEEISSRVDRMDEDDQKKLIDKALRKLPQADSLLITLFYHAQNSIEEISYVTGLSASNVKVRLHRIRKRLYDDISEMTRLQTA
jgi:RNA polymerase sigma factor (sigma-70 family)